MKMDVRVTLRDDEGTAIMGLGVIWLLRGIDEHHSISEAARSMELSYPKALRMIRNLEKGFHQPVVARHKGGNLRGGAELTSAGKDFLARFVTLQDDVERYAAGRFQKHLGSLLHGLDDSEDEK